MKPFSESGKLLTPLLLACALAFHARADAQFVINPAWVKVSNRYLTLAVEPTTGRFHLYTAGGGRGIIAPVTSDINGAHFRIDPAPDDPYSNIAQFGEGGEVLTQAVAVTPESILTVWETEEGLDNENTGDPGGPSIRVEQRLTLLRDVLKIEYKVTNRGRYSHKIGTRVVLQPDFRILSALPHSEIPVVPGLSPIGFRTSFSLISMPSLYNVFEANPTSGDILSTALKSVGIISGESATTPTELLFIDDAEITGDPYELPDESYSRILNVAPVLIFSDVSYTSGQSRIFVTYFGLGSSTTDYEPNPVAALECPSQVSLVEGDDPATTDITERFYFSPGSLTVRAFIYNTSAVALADTTVRLLLPTGLEFQSGESSSKSTGNIPAYNEKSVSWRVNVNGFASGQLPVILTTSSAGASSKSITRYVDVPPLPQDFTVDGLSMVAFPYTFDDPNPGVVFIDRTTSATLSPLYLATWDPDLNDYLKYSTGGGITELSAGVGYWLQTSRSTPLDLQGAHPVSSSADFLLPLKKEWSMVGDPFLSSVYLGRVKFFYSGESYDWIGAIQRGLLRSTMWTYDAGIRDYVAVGEQTSELKPMVGYWLKALVSGLTMVFPSDINEARNVVNTHPANSSPALPGDLRRSGKASDWLLQLSVRSADSRYRSSRSYLGVSFEATDRFDLTDIEGPPPFSGYVSLRFPHSDWGDDAGYFVQDVRRAFSGERSWDVEAVTDQPNTSFVLTWPTIQRVPRPYRFTLVDLDTGRRVYMRTVESYAYTSGKAGCPRRFRIEVTTDPAGALRVTGFVVSSPLTRSRALSVSFALSRDAEVRCAIRTASGRLVRVIDPGTLRKKGVNALTWDARGNAGQFLPRGVYVVDIRATTEEQQTVRVVKTLQVR